jgi:hypothetical protein
MVLTSQVVRPWKFARSAILQKRFGFNYRLRSEETSGVTWLIARPGRPCVKKAGSVVKNRLSDYAGQKMLNEYIGNTSVK